MPASGFRIDDASTLGLVSSSKVNMSSAGFLPFRRSEALTVLIFLLIAVLWISEAEELLHEEPSSRLILGEGLLIFPG